MITRNTLLLAATTLVFVVAVGSSLLFRDSPAAAEDLLRDILTTSRPTRARLAGVPYREPTSVAAEDLSRLQFLVLQAGSDSETSYLSAYSHVLQRNWEEATDRLERLNAVTPGDFQITNDLGAVYLERADTAATYLLRAFRQFERASALEPEAPEPLFNLALVFHRLHLDEDAAETSEKFRSIESDSEWAGDLERRLLAGTNLPVRSSTDEFWQRVFQEALDPRNGPPEEPISLQDLEHYEDEYEDVTPRAILSALKSERGDAIFQLRREIRRARDAYEREEFEASVQMIDAALARYPYPLEPFSFDGLWANLNRAEALVQTRLVREAAPMLEQIIESAGDAGFPWLLARGSTVYGSHPSMGSRATLIPRLRTAVEVFESIGNFRDSILARILLAGQLFGEGSYTESFDVAIMALDYTFERDYLRRYQLARVIGGNPLLAGSRLELAFAHSAAAYAERTKSPSAIADAYTALAFVLSESEDFESAEAFLTSAEGSLEAIPADAGRIRARFDLNLTKAEFLMETDRSVEAIPVLQEGLDAVDRDSLNVYFRQRYYLALAEAYLALNRFDEADSALEAAVSAVETEDDELGRSAQLTFDEFRRHVYEAAIAHHIDRGNENAAWRYAQQYRNKLLAELVQGYGPANNAFARRIAASGTDSTRLEGRVLLEYMLLEDRILIWLVRPDGTRTVRSAPVTRDEVRETATRFLTLLTTASHAAEVEALSRTLDEWLIEPVRDLIERETSIVIVPDRILHRLPFQALLSETGRYLVEDHTIALTPSLRYYLAAAEISRTAPKLVSLGSSDNGSAIRTELRNVAAMYADIESVDGFDVTPEVFLDSVSGASLLHYAGHSAFDGVNALTSAVRLRGDADGPGSVTAIEIAGRQMAPNALVVLSSCDSSVGNSIGGVGVRGLTSAFLIAGAGSVVGSLWPVESGSTAELMIMFHSRVADGMPISDALREAQLELMEAEPHPYYWSGFNVTGNRSALEPAAFVAPAAVAGLSPVRILNASGGSPASRRESTPPRIR